MGNLDFIKILILDDEEHARDSISILLNRYLKIPFEVQEASTAAEAIDILQTESFDLVFLDVHLEKETSFEIFSRIDEIDFKVIFITGHDEYAVRAFRFNATDYILKPINPLEFKEAIEKLEYIHPLETKEVQKLKNDIRSEDINKLILKDINTIYFVDIEDIQYCTSDRNYTTFILSNGEEITISKTMKEYEKLLKSINFFRTH
ncbi:MAG: LytTR family DNA-binding domain-containing protein, partial [Bacteroidota bacterium]